jgi:hypothetical protein
MSDFEDKENQGSVIRPSSGESFPLSDFDSLVANFFSAVDNRVDAWFGSWFGQQNLERASEAYKLIYRAKEDLKSRLKGE